MISTAHMYAKSSVKSLTRTIDRDRVSGNCFHGRLIMKIGGWELEAQRIYSCYDLWVEKRILMLRHRPVGLQVLRSQPGVQIDSHRSPG